MTAQGGSATIPAFTDPPEIQVTHGVGGVPTVVLVTRQDDPNGRDCKVDDARVDGTNLIIEMDSMDGLDHGFYWYAE